MENNLRTPKDRLRHTILFELILLAILIPSTSILLNKPIETMGTLNISMSLLAMALNFFYNYTFDHALRWLGKPVYERGKRLRLVHSILFEIVLFIFGAPLIMYVLDYTFMQAVLYDVAFMIAVPIYAFIFNIAYDRVFPPPTQVTVTT